MNTIAQLSNSNKTLCQKESYTSPSSSYVQRRVLDRITPSTGSSNYTPNSTSRISWRLPAGSYMDPNDSFFSFFLKVDATLAGADQAGEADSLVSWHGAHTLFERMTITIGGVVVEDINNLNVLEQMIHMACDDKSMTSTPIGYAQGLKDTQHRSATDQATMEIAKSEQLKTGCEFIFKPLASGILTNDKLLPLPYLPEVHIDLYLAPTSIPFQYTNAAAGLKTLNYTLSDVSLHVPYVEFDKTFIGGFEASLQKSPLNYHFNTFSNFVSTITNSADIAIGSFRTDIKSLFTTVRTSSELAMELDSFQYKRRGIESYQLSLGSQKYPLAPIQVEATKNAVCLAYTTQALSNLKSFNNMNLDYQDWTTGETFIVGVDMSSSDSVLGGVDSSLTFGSPLLLAIKGNGINKAHSDTFVHYGSILSILPDRSIVCTF